MVTQSVITEDIFKEYLEMGFNPFGSGPVSVFVRRSEEAISSGSDHKPRQDQTLDPPQNEVE